MTDYGLDLAIDKTEVVIITKKDCIAIQKLGYLGRVFLSIVRQHTFFVIKPWCYRGNFTLRCRPSSYVCVIHILIKRLCYNVILITVNVVSFTNMEGSNPSNEPSAHKQTILN